MKVHYHFQTYSRRKQIIFLICNVSVILKIHVELKLKNQSVHFVNMSMKVFNIQQ